MMWMPDATDMDLVREYAARQTEPAFETLVNRHVSLVYSTALRRVGNPASAEEITQAVFIILARKAAKLRHDAVLPAWLHETTRHVAASFLRGEIRRRHREQEAYMQSTLPSDDAMWDQLAPLLDEAIGRLRTSDRNVVVLHYFQNQTAREIAAALNIGEEAAKKRLTRAVGKLRLDFFKRGINVSTAALSGMVPARSVQAAPVAFAKTLTASALAKGVTASTSTLTPVKGALKIMAWTKAKTAAVATAIVLLAAATGTMAVKSARNHLPGSRLISPREIYMKAYFLDVPESDVSSVLAAGTAINTPNNNSAEIMDYGKMAAVLRLLQSHQVTTLAAPSVVSLFDRQTQLHVDNYAVDLFPTLLADGYGIKMKMIGSSQISLTAEANLWDGQTLALGGPPSGGQTRLFVFATVTMLNQSGNRIHSDADLRSRLGTIPPQ